MVQTVTDQQPHPVKLGDWLRAMKVSNIDHIYKKNRPALLPHGEFRGGRTAAHLWKPSGIIQYDIDLSANPGLIVDECKRRAADDPTILLCARSAGGGVWGLAIRQPDQDQQLNSIETLFDVKLDTANSRNMAALRFAAYDSEPYTNHTT